MAKFTSSMKIAQSGDSAVMSLDDTDFYAGGTIDDLKKPNNGEAVFIACGTQPAPTDFGSILRAQVTTGANGTAMFKATEIFQADGFNFFATCKWTFKRTDPTPPSVPGC